MQTSERFGNIVMSGSGLTVEQLEQQRILAMRAWETRPLRRMQPRPVYGVRRADATKALVWQGMGALAVLGAIMLVSAF